MSQKRPIICSVAGCHRRAKSAGDLCQAHKLRRARTGSTDGPALGPEPDSHHPLYQDWKMFVRRGQLWKYEICEAWKTNFHAFLGDMGTRPTRRHTLIRIDEDAPYSPENCMWATAAEKHAKNIKPVSLAALQEAVIRPGIEKFLTPLLLYRGNLSPGRAHRLWNLAIAMMKTECTTFGEGILMSNNEDYAQLCGPERTPAHSNLYGFFSRLRLNKQVTDNVEGLTEYAEWLLPRPFDLVPVSMQSAYHGCAPWRIYKRPDRADDGLPGNVRAESIKTADRCYPYVVWERENPANRLSALVNAIVPRGLPEELRADVCQDLIVDLLSGDLSEEALVGSRQKYIGQKLRSYRYSDRFNTVALDTELIDLLQHDEAKRRFDEYVEEELEADDPEDSDPFKDYVREKLGDKFKISPARGRAA